MYSFKKNIKVSVLDNEIQNLVSEISRQKFPSGFGDMLIYILSELSANVVEHSNAKKAHIRIEAHNGKISLSVSDDGIGIRKSYLGNNNFAKDDRSAVMLALSGLSTKELNERAFGLYSIRQLAEYQNGLMKIDSGKISVGIEKGKINFADKKKAVKGVSVSIQMRIGNVNIYDVIK